MVRVGRSPEIVRPGSQVPSRAPLTGLRVVGGRALRVVAFFTFPRVEESTQASAGLGVLSLTPRLLETSYHVDDMRTWLVRLFVALPFLVTSTTAQGATQDPTAVVASVFIYEDATFPAAHASTVAETSDGLVASWFSGSEEGAPDVSIWVSRHDGAGWSDPVEVADGRQLDGSRHPCWNPVLFQPSGGPLLLFYKTGPNPREWWGLVRTSTDQGRTWSDAIELPSGVLGPIRAKPVELEPGTMIAGSSTEHDGWVVHMEWFTTDSQVEREWQQALGSTGSWRKTSALNDPEEFAAIQPTILVHSPTELQILCRSRQGLITQVWSTDGGRSWSQMIATGLANPSAGIDAVRLADGRFLLVYNPTTRGRRNLAVAVSEDGRTWRLAATLEDAESEYSYPAMIQTRDGLVHVTYTWRRERIKHVVLDPEQIN